MPEEENLSIGLARSPRCCVSKGNSPFVNDDHPKIIELLLACQIDIGIVDRVDADNMGLSDLIQDLSDPLIKRIMADFPAIPMTNRLDPQNRPYQFLGWLEEMT